MFKSKTGNFRTGLILFSALIVFSIFTSAVSAGTATLSWTAPTTNTDGSQLTDLAGYKVYYGTSSKSYSASVSIGNTTTYTTSNLPDGTYYFAVTALDTSNSESGYSNEVSKSITTTVSTGTAALSWSAPTTNTDGSQLTDLAGYKVHYGTSSKSYTSSVNVGNTATYTANLAAGTYYFAVTAYDTSGNESGYSSEVSKTIVSGTTDTTPPTGTISINSGSTYTNNTLATLSLSCTDTGGSCSQMQFSNDNTSWSTAEAYSAAKSWTMTTANGTKTVYVKFKDNAGNWSTAYNDTITLDNVAPAVTIATVTSPTASNSQTIAGTTESGASVYVSTDTSASDGAAVVSGASWSYTVTGLAAGVNKITATAKDAAGNISTASASIALNVAIFTSTSPASGAVINSATVGYTLDRVVAGGTVTFTRTGGSNDPTSPYVYNLTASDVAAGTHSVNTGFNLVSGAVYTIAFDVTDSSGNKECATNTSVTYDSNAASVTINSPASNSIINNATVAYTLSENISAGEIVFTGDDGISPHTYQLTSSDRTSGSHSVDTGALLLDGVYYTVSFRNVADQAGNLTSAVSNTNIKYDIATVAISNTTPKPSSSVTSATVGYSLSEQASSGKVTFTRTGGKIDRKSPQVYNFNADDLAAGVHTINTNLPLVRGTTYTVSFDASDLMGNKATTVSNAGVTYKGR